MLTSSDVERAVAFMRRGDIRGTREEPWQFGTAVFTPELPLRHDSNYLLLERDGSAEEIAATAERAQADLSHRVILVPGERAAQRLEAGFRQLGWEVRRFLVMVLRRPPNRTRDLSRVDEVDEESLREVRKRDIGQHAWGTPELVEQLVAARQLMEMESRYFAVLVDGDPVSFADLYLEGDTAQVEAVATFPEHRGKGYASAVVARAVQEAQQAGASWIFLVADADDWPQELYRKLGFDAAGRYYKFSRIVGRE
jgi:ribosomal protein S18 acetylase RimI-like enzyme